MFSQLCTFLMTLLWWMSFLLACLWYPATSVTLATSKRIALECLFIDACWQLLVVVILCTR